MCAGGQRDIWDKADMDAQVPKRCHNGTECVKSKPPTEARPNPNAELKDH